MNWKELLFPFNLDYPLVIFWHYFLGVIVWAIMTQTPYLWEGMNGGGLGVIVGAIAYIMLHFFDRR